MSKSFKYVFLLILIITITGYSVNVSAQTPENYVKVKGALKNYQGKVTIQVFVIDSANHGMIEKSVILDEYVLVFDPTLDYKVLFTDGGSITKTLYHKSGFKGVWVSFLDIDFKLEKKCLTMEQFDTDYYSYIACQ